MRSLLSKKGQIQSLAPAMIALVLAAVLLVFGLIMLQELRDTAVVAGSASLLNDTAFTAANATIIGMGTFADFWEIIVLAIVISIVIGLLLMVFGGSSQR